MRIISQGEVSFPLPSESIVKLTCFGKNRKRRNEDIDRKNSSAAERQSRTKRRISPQRAQRSHRRRFGFGSLTAKNAKYAKEDNGGRVFNPPTPGFGKFAHVAQTFNDSRPRITRTICAWAVYDQFAPIAPAFRVAAVRDGAGHSTPSASKAFFKRRRYSRPTVS